MKTQVAGPALSVSDSAHLGWGPRSFISDTLSGDSEAAGPRPQFFRELLTCGEAQAGTQIKRSELILKG